MKARTKFLKIYHELPIKTRTGTVWKPYIDNPRSLRVIALEVAHKTPLGDKILKNMGFADD